MTPVHLAKTRRSALYTALAAGVVFTATAFAGATQHGPAFVLRALVVVVCVWWWPGQRPALRWRDSAAPLFAMGVVCLGLLQTPVAGFALQRVITVVLVCALYAACLASERDRFDEILLAAVVVGGAHTLWAAAQWVAGQIRGHGGFFNPNDLAAFLAPLLVICLVRVLVPTTFHRSRRRWWWLGATLLLSLGLVTTGSRSGLLAAVIAGAIVALAAVGENSRRRVVLLVGFGVAGILLSMAFWARWSGRDDPYAYNRLEIWQHTTQIAMKNPLGVGLGFYRHAMRVAGVPLPGPVRFPKVARHAHSEPLHAWAELGWPGLVACLLPVAMVILAIRRRGHGSVAESETNLAQETHTLRKLMLAQDWAILASFAIPATLSGSLHVPPVAFLAAAWAASVSKKGTMAGPVIRLPAPRLWIATLTLLALALAVPGAISAHTATAAAARRAAGDLDGALALAEVSRASAPWSLGAAMLFESLLYLRGKKATAASAELLVLAERFAYSPKPLTRAAWLLETNAGEDASIWRSAAAIRERAVKRDPHNAVAWYQLAQAQAAAGQHQQSEATLRHTIIVEPRMARALAELAQRAQARGEQAPARTLADRAWAANQLANHERGYPKKILALGHAGRAMLEEIGFGEK